MCGYAVRGLLTVSVLVCLALVADAYPRYRESEAGGACVACHGDFTGAQSPKDTTFPDDSKHEMHRALEQMDTNCDLCHTDGDDDNPFLSSSNGTNDTQGFGCVGCHGRVEDAGNDGLSDGLGAGLRQHHWVSGIVVCGSCHSDANPANYTPVGEDVPPPYHGSVDTNVDDSCNRPPEFRENWSVGDTSGLDNDGDNVYDEADPDCVPEPGSMGVMVAFAGLLVVASQRRRASSPVDDLTAHSCTRSRVPHEKLLPSPPLLVHYGSEFSSRSRSGTQ